MRATVLAGVLLAACTPANQPLHVRTTIDAPPERLLREAITAAYNQGYTITAIDAEHPSFVAARAGEAPMYVEIDAPQKGHCHGACKTTLAIRPLGFTADGKVTFLDTFSDVIDAQQRALMATISARTLGERDVGMF